MTRRNVLASLPASVRALNATRLDARDAHAAQGAAARVSGDAFERDVYDALDVLVSAGSLAWWEHTEAPRIVVRGDVRFTRKALCDVVGCTRDGRAFVAEIKRATTGYVDLVSPSKRRAKVLPHQAAQLTATANAGGVALLAVEVCGVRALIAWRDLRDVTRVTVEVARRYEVRSLSAALARRVDA